MSRREARDLVDAYSHWQLATWTFPSSSPHPDSRNDTPLRFGTRSSFEAARRAGATRLVSEDLQTGRRLAGVLIDNPFTSTS
jgi:hypothetical protein